MKDWLMVIGFLISVGGLLWSYAQIIAEARWAKEWKPGEAKPLPLEEIEGELRRDWVRQRKMLGAILLIVVGCLVAASGLCFK